jgi:MFS transporter, AAHS family, 4-hydroxybenzoate transporter
VQIAEKVGNTREAVQSMPHGVVVATVGFLVAMIDGYDTLVLSFITPLIAKEWALNAGTVGGIFAASYAGAAVGSTFIGVAADRFGRKSMLLVSIAIAGIFTILCAWAADAHQLMLLRAAAGLGLGGAIPTTTALTAQYAEPHRRNAAVTRMFLGYPIGAIVGGAVTALVMGRVGWRGVLLGGGVAALLLLLPVLIALRNDVRPLPADPRHTRFAIAELVSQGRGMTTVFFCLAVFLMLLTSYFLVSWTPTLLASHGLPPQRAAAAGVVLSVGGVAGALLLSFLIGRRSPVLFVAASLCIGALLIAMVSKGASLPSAGAVTLVFAVGLFVLGAQGSIPALAVHLYPPSIYATGVGLSVAVGRIGSIVGPLIGGYLVAIHLGWERLFLVAATPTFLAAVSMAALYRNRRNGGYTDER